MPEELTALEEKLAEKIAADRAAKTSKFYVPFNECKHTGIQKLLSEIGAVRLFECQTCGLVTGYGR